MSARLEEIARTFVDECVRYGVTRDELRFWLDVNYPDADPGKVARIVDNKIIITIEGNK